MGVEIALGLGLAGAAGLYGAKQQDNARKNNEAAAQTQHNFIQSQAMGMMQGPNSNPFQQMLTQFMRPGATGGAGQTPTSYASPSGPGGPGTPNVFMSPNGPMDVGNPDMGAMGRFGNVPGATDIGSQMGGAGGAGGGGNASDSFGMKTGAYTYNPSQVSGSNIDINSILGSGDLFGGTGGAYGQAQAAMLSQLMGGAPGYAANANVDSALNAQLAGNNVYDNTGVFKALAGTEQIAQNEQLAQLHGSFGSLGQRFGTAAMNQEANLRAKLQSQNDLMHQQIGSQSFESAQGRSLQAAGIGAQREAAASQAGIAGYQARLSGLSSLMGLGINEANTRLGEGQLRFGVAGANQANQLQSGLANQAANNSAGQFNASQNQQSDQFYNSFMAQLMGMGSGMYGQSQNYNQNLLQIMAGQAPVQQGYSAVPGAVGDFGQLIAMLPFLKKQG